MQRFLDAWETIRERPLPWVVITGTWSVLSVLTSGLGLVLMPNLWRAMQRGVDSGNGPVWTELFNFESLTDDLLTMLMWLVAVTLGALVGVVVVLAPAIVLFWMPLLAMSGRYEGIEAAKASFSHTKRNFGDVALFVLLVVAGNALGAVTCVGWLLTVPVTMLATLTYFRAEEAAIGDAADADGVSAT